MCNIEDPTDVISRSKLREDIEELTWYHANKAGVLVEGASSDCDAYYLSWQIFDKIDTAHPVIPKTDVFEWCHNCKEYDQEDHCCHRWSNKIRETIEEYKDVQLDEIRPHGH